MTNGNIASATREVPNWPVIINLRADPYEKAPHESGLYFRGDADNIWLFVPVQEKAQGVSHDAAGISIPAGKQPERRGHQLQLPTSNAGIETPEGIGKSFVAAQLTWDSRLT